MQSPGVTLTFKLLCLALTAVVSVAQAAPSKPFKPKSFTADEFATLSLITELIMPSVDGPGAREAKVSQFIDFQTEYDHELKGRFRDGIQWLDHHARRKHGRIFRALNPNQRHEILDALAYKALHRPGEEPGREFYKLVRRYTEMGFYTSKVGMETLKTAPERPPGPQLRPARRVSGGNASPGG